MKLTLVTWKIAGVRPLMQGNPAGMTRNDSADVTTKSRKSQTAFDEAKAQLYQRDDGLFFHPSIAFWKSLFVACPFRKIGKMAASSVISSAVAQAEEEFILYDPTTLDSKKPRPLSEKEWLVDTRRAVNNNKGKGGVGIIVARPKWKSWGGFLTLEVDEEFFPGGFDVLTQLLNIAGRYGIGVGRIKKNGTDWGGLGLGKFSAELKG